MRMHKNRWWLIFLTTIALIVAWYCAVAFYKIYFYSKLNAETQTVSIQWGIKMLSDEQYTIQADYTFDVDGKIYQGHTNFRDEIYMNEWSAEQAILKDKKKLWKVWYQAGYFDHSTLQKKFPTKECYSAGVMLALLLYFVWLGFYVTRYQV
jgi:hypothetical protein